LERVTQTLNGLYGYTNIGVTWEQGSITATGEDSGSYYDSRLRSDDWIDISGYNTLVVSVLNGFRAYVVLANSAYGRIHESPSLWVTNAIKFDVSTASYMRICFSKSNDVTVPYATITDAQNNFIACGITSTDFTLKRNDAFYSTLTPAYSSRYVFGKGKMWEYLWNTKEAYVAAGEDSRCWGIDGDVQFTSDNKLVMYHDKTVNYNGSNVAISSLTLEQVQSIVLTSGGVEYSIPTLEEFVKICRRYGKICMIETKGSTDAFVWNTNHSALLEEMVSMLEDYGMTDSSVFVVQFSDVVWLQDRYPNISCMTILDNNTTEANVNRLRNHPNVIEGGRAAGWSDNDTVKVVHGQGRKVMAYTSRPQTSSMIDDMRAINADAIFLFADPDV
jgi:glycerophosphoryl diester phosphodiesterase